MCIRDRTAPVAAWRLRLQSDYRELVQDENTSSAFCVTRLENPVHLRDSERIFVNVEVCEGDFRGQCFSFMITVGERYPYEPVSIHCTDFTAFHPNIERSTRAVYLNLLSRREWTPTTGLLFILYNLELTLIEPDGNYLPDCEENRMMFYQLRDRHTLQLERLTIRRDGMMDEEEEGRHIRDRLKRNRPSDLAAEEMTEILKRIKI
eukprot:TRINITY_DN13657_c0_g1_i1.p1 TRINITY_DN13657_c0_g1~~TRINITY_DN13657_c0_g1_i1.p1  ORF type:complete len:206 (+),score=25.80 TRINITY_DN13657_c0_g1_i1:64-681(+)